MAPQKTDNARSSTDRDLLVKDANIWTRNGFSKGSILIQNGRISRLAHSVNIRGVEGIEASGLYALPGLIDVHVHLRDMKLAYKEDFVSGTASAAAGGFTTVLDMPNTLPPTDSPRRLVEKRRVAAKKAYVNVGFHAAATQSLETIHGLAREGAFSLKLYMPKPISPFNVRDDGDIRKLMQRARRAKITVTVHAEDLETAETKAPESFEQLAKDRGPDSETRALERIDRLQRSTGCQVHYCHMTLASSLKRIRSRSPKSTSEVTPHHLLLSRTQLRKLGWKAWMVPPLRTEFDRRALVAATRAGFADVVASDHAPHALSEKNRLPRLGVPGVPGLETTLPLMLTLVNKRILRFSDLIRMLAENPAKIFSLHSKGRIQPGYDGDIILIDLRRRSRIDSSKFFSKAKFSPFDDFRTIGTVASTIVGGRVVYDNGQLVGKQGSGSVLRRTVSS